MLLASNDARYAGVAYFLLMRRGLHVELVSNREAIPDRSLRGADVLVVDTSGPSDAMERTVSRVEERHPGLGIVVVTEEEGPPSGHHAHLAKWSSLDALAGEIEHVYSTTHARKASMRHIL